MSMTWIIERSACSPSKTLRQHAEANEENGIQRRLDALDEIEGPGRDAVEGQDRHHKGDDQDADQDGDDGEDSQPSNRRFERPRLAGNVLSKRDQFDRDLAQARLGKPVRNASFQQFRRRDDALGVDGAIEDLLAGRRHLFVSLAGPFRRRIGSAHPFPERNRGTPT
jgi:hypothetical protein